jgi:eukaryotic-like serine/threonine-protein kinase
VTPNNDEWIGLEIAGGRYRIVGRIGQGTMGRVYLANDRRLETDVVVKFPIATEKTAAGAEFLARFDREIRSLIRLSHPHIVKVLDAGELEGHPFVVMEYLAGGSLKDRIGSGPVGEPTPMALQSLRGWVPEIAKAIDFVHTQNHIHRDVKPANILFDRHGNAFLSDFGIIKAIATEEADWRGNSLTAPGFLVGTPNYVAPEIVMGRRFDGRVDQYSLAMTVHEALTGTNCMEGPTPSATVVNQTMVVPPPLTELFPGIPSRVSNAILRALAKDPDERFENCNALAQELLSAIPGDSNATQAPQSESTSRGRPGRVPCPACQALMPVGREHAGGRVRCLRCRATSQVSLLSSSTVQLKLLDAGTSSSDSSIAMVVDPPDDEAQVDSSAATALALPVASRPAREPGPRLWFRQKPAIAVGSLLGIAGLVFLVWALGRGLGNGHPSPVPLNKISDDAPPSASKPSDPPQAIVALPESVELNIAYGTEKQQWFEAATAEFSKSEAGRGITVNLFGMGSMEGARAVLEGPHPIPIHVWSPASSAYRDHFEREWRAKHGNKPPVIKSENLALTPMVCVMWESRRMHFLKKYATVNFQTLSDAMQAPGGWAAIAGRPEWGRFKFGHTHPGQSNSGLLMLVLLAYEFAHKEHGLALADVTEPKFQTWLGQFERAVARPGGSLNHSTGTLMLEMVLRGPSHFDCVLIYENLAVASLGAARDRSGELHVDYPEPNIWNDHPFYILDVPWSDSRERSAAARLLKFLMSEPIQKRALEYGFRPGNPEISMRFPESPFIRHASHGVRIDLPRMCEPPNHEVLQELLASSRRIED